VSAAATLPFLGRLAAHGGPRAPRQTNV